jgi:hypothetical protein
MVRLSIYRWFVLFAALSVVCALSGCGNTVQSETREAVVPSPATANAVIASLRLPAGFRRTPSCYGQDSFCFVRDPSLVLSPALIQSWVMRFGGSVNPDTLHCSVTHIGRSDMAEMRCGVDMMRKDEKFTIGVLSLVEARGGTLAGTMRGHRGLQNGTMLSLTVIGRKT